jgi:3-phenylpropionate/trans-cinnamate dioxygenase ferredoxin subunit
MIGEGREDDEVGESGQSNEVPFVDVCATTDVPDGGVVAFRAQGRDFLLCRADSSFYAISDRCTHAAWNLAGSEIRGCEIVCSLHGARFDLRTGAAVAAPARKPIGTFPVRTRAARIEVQVTPPPR